MLRRDEFCLRQEIANSDTFSENYVLKNICERHLQPKSKTMDYQQYSTYSGYQGYNPYGQYPGANHLKVSSKPSLIDVFK